MNIYDIAAEAGVSIASVSRVINNNGRVGKETRKKIEQVLQKYNYRPNAAARGLVTKSMRTIGILTVDIRVTHYANAIYILEQAMHRMGYNVIVCNTGGFMKENLYYMRMLLNRQVDGLVLIGSVFEELSDNAEGMEYLRRQPVVIANGSLPLDNAFSVLVDDPLGTRLSVQHLVKKGYSDIYYVQDLNTGSADRKAEGFCAAMQAAGLPGEERILRSGYGLDAGAQMAENLLQSDKKISALVFGEDSTALGAMKVLQKAGMRIPQDIAIVGYNNSEYARMSTPEMTSVDNRYQLLGEYSAKLMVDLLEGNDSAVDVTIRPILVERESS